jgi:hypothetical protein
MPKRTASGPRPLRSKHASNPQESELERRTPSMYAISNRCGPAPTLALAFILSMRPGKVGGTETTIAAAARQFCEIFSEILKCQCRRGLLFHGCIYTCHEAYTSKERRPGCGAQASTEWNQVPSRINKPEVVGRAYISDDNSCYRR